MATIPCAVEELVMTGVGKGTMVIVSVAVPVPPAFVALSVTGKAPDKVGVPEITPVVFIERPAGNPVALKLVGLLVAAIT